MPDAAASADHLVFDRATPEDWTTVTGWAADEGWNPGLRDAAAFFAQDPDGFLIGRLSREPATAVSVVNYGYGFAFLGFYLVRPELRGRGLGIATWKAGLAHAGRRIVGLDGVPDQQGNYRRSGFELAYNTARFVGIPDLPPPDGTVRIMGAADTADVHDYDSACLPADRPEFLRTWLGNPGHRTIVRIVDGDLAGFGTVRPARDSHRIGPLFADSADTARQLLAALAAQSGGAPVAIDAPLCNESAVRLCEEAGLVPSFETARMYTGPVRSHCQERVFGVTTLELG
ncbi:MAG: hypothetical protein JWN03_1439 [Nocardia sp.]|uniref:GNAT family N-acetyltransferase n=1 Tax=Nocardia sp. TaxID=1821 RepID=UPI0026252EDF|nr:GNAT family N-acetyltransferase [Nocardia sp.]MCU1641164.1 hypothetical protein [Nocardia sp.]